MTQPKIRLGYEVGSGRPVDIPVRHMAVTGQTQESGKTTTLEALIRRSSLSALAFVTKRGESSFAEGRRVPPYFRDRADWQFVTSILDATLQEKNKFLRPWIMKICRTTRTLAEVQAKVREALATAKGIHEGVYTQLDAYLDLIVPEIQRADLAGALRLGPGLNVMDLGGYATPMQMLFVQSALDWINERERDTIVLMPEAWEFVPEGKGSPVKAAAVDLVRKGGGIKNYIWVDSQDMAGVDKVILRGCAVWLIGVQREANEIRRNLANIPASVKRPTAADVAQLERGQFFACWHNHCLKTYVQPAWLAADDAVAIARGARTLPPAPAPPRRQAKKEGDVDRADAERLIRENHELRRRVEDLEAQLAAPSRRAPAASPVAAAPAPAQADGYDAIRRRLLEDLRADPELLRLVVQRPEIRVEIERPMIEASGETLFGRLAQLIAEGFFDEARAGNAAYQELQRRGFSTAKPNVYREADKLAAKGFLTKEAAGGYQAVAGMKVNIVERGA